MGSVPIGKLVSLGDDNRGKPSSLPEIECGAIVSVERGNETQFSGPCFQLASEYWHTQFFLSSGGLMVDI